MSRWLRLAPAAALPARVLVLGQGYVGLQLAIRAAEVGHDVVAYDIDAAKVAQLLSGRSHVGDVTDLELRRCLASGRFHPIADAAALGEFDVALITVPTPLAAGVPDLGPVTSAAERVGTLVRPGCLVVLESTTYPGTTDELLVPLLEAASGLKAGVDFHVGYSPERVDPGNREWTLVRIRKVVSGLTPACLEAVDAFYRGLVERTVPVSSTRVAELTKLLENTSRHVNVAVPIVAADVRGCRQVVEHGTTGLLVPRGDAGALRAAIGTLAASPERRQAMGAAGRATAEREFDEHEVVRRVMDAYAWAAEQRGIRLT